jgi:hypothetical protein
VPCFDICAVFIFQFSQYYEIILYFSCKEADTQIFQADYLTPHDLKLCRPLVEPSPLIPKPNYNQKMFGDKKKWCVAGGIAHVVEHLPA